MQGDLTDTSAKYKVLCVCSGLLIDSKVHDLNSFQYTFELCFQVQAAVWSAACEGRSIHAVAPTGSGKTLAFVLPMAAVLSDAGHGRHTQPGGPVALVLSPTRELALQTLAVMRPLHGMYGLASTCLYGGVDKQSQVDSLTACPHMVVATPGRYAGYHVSSPGKLSTFSLKNNILRMKVSQKIGGLILKAKSQIISR